MISSSSSSLPSWRKWKSAADYDLEGQATPRWCGSVIPRTVVRHSDVGAHLDVLKYGSIPCNGTRR